MKITKITTKCKKDTVFLTNIKKKKMYILSAYMRRSFYMCTWVISLVLVEECRQENSATKESLKKKKINVIVQAV